MKTTNAMQLKAKIKARAKEAGVSPQLMMQDYLLERLLERISLSKWRDCVVVKGGMLIASLVGVNSRVTKDLDTTVRGFDLTHESARRAFRDICEVDVDDDIAFEFVRTEDIREVDDYPGIRVFLKANYAPMSVPLSVDVTTGDAITPGAVEYDYPLAFDDYSINIMAYPTATCMAEKLETVVARGVANTRPRDYYDICMLWRTRRAELPAQVLAAALAATASKRGSLEAMRGYAEAMGRVMEDPVMEGRWRAYAKDYSYVGEMTLQEACMTVVEILGSIGWAAEG